MTILPYTYVHAKNTFYNSNFKHVHFQENAIDNAICQNGGHFVEGKMN